MTDYSPDAIAHAKLSLLMVPDHHLATMAQHHANDPKQLELIKAEQKRRSRITESAPTLLRAVRAAFVFIKTNPANKTWGKRRTQCTALLARALDEATGEGSDT